MIRLIQVIGLSILSLFLIPIVFQSYGKTTPPLLVTHADATSVTGLKQEPITVRTDTKQVLFLFTHSQEAFPGRTESTGQLSVYHPSHNITGFSGTISQAFSSEGLVAKPLNVDTMQLLSKHGKGFDQAYATVRPYIKEAIAKERIDVVIDFHRDSAKAKTTTLKINGESYAKVMLIVGGEHEAYKGNQQFAQALSDQLEKQVPGLSRGVLVKQGRGVDGVYNQDLHPATLLIELGGIENSPEEVEATIQQIATALGAIL